MKLPERFALLVSRGKVIEYLLSETHVDGRHKAKFFRLNGFSPEKWEQLSDLLLSHGQRFEIAHEEAYPYGTHYTVEGSVEIPGGRTLNIRTVWIVSAGAVEARLVTAYPLEGR